MTDLPLRYHPVPGHCCPYCLKPVGYIGRGLSVLFGARIHRCDFLNVDSEAEQLRRRVEDAENDVSRIHNEKIDLLEDIHSSRRKIKELEGALEESRDEALAEAAHIAILAGNHLSILPPSVRKFPEAGGIIASRILERRSVPLTAPVDNGGEDRGEL